MWANTDSPIWDIQSEKNIKLNFNINLKEKINKWNLDFSDHHKKWLEEDKNTSVFSLKSQLHMDGRQLLEDIEKDLKQDIKLYYWFDVDRSLEQNESFIWTKCPICKSNLIKINASKSNRVICEKCKLLFP